jgi:hypothetical protein
MRIPVLLLEGQDNLTVSQNGNKSWLLKDDML